MINYVDRLIKAQKLVGIPDDDVTVEQRFKSVRWGPEGSEFRRMQRRAFLICEQMRTHPEEYQHLYRDQERIARNQSGPAPRVAGASSSCEPPQEPFNFEGIEATAPASLRRGES